MPDEGRVTTPFDAPAEPAPPRTSPRFEATFGTFSKIVLTNGLMNLPTFGFYRFWGKTRLRRYVWSHLSLDGEALEYSGQAKELLLGFMVAMAFLLPVILTPIGLSVAGTPQSIALAADLAQSVVLIYLIQVAIFRARRYRLSRTQWRGIRGGQSGSSWEYGLKAFAWGFFMLITAGLGFAVFRTRLQEYRTENTWFGDRQFVFQGQARKLFWTWFLAWILLLPTFGMSYIWYRVREFRYFASVTRVGNLTFESKLEAGTPIVLVIFFSVILMFFGSAISMAVFGILNHVGGLDGLGQMTNEQIEQFSPIASGASILVFLLFLLFYGMMRMMLLVFPITGAICRTLTITGEEDWAAIAQSQQLRPGRGEGLADSLDVGDF